MGESKNFEMLAAKYGHPDQAPESVRQRDAMLDRLYRDDPVVPTKANGGPKEAAPEVSEETSMVAVEDELTKEVSFQYPDPVDEVIEDEPDPVPIPAKIEERVVAPVVHGTAMTYEEMRDHVLSRSSPEELLGLMISRCKTKERLRLKEGRFTFPLDVMFFSANDVQVAFYIDKDIVKDVRFEEGGRYDFEYQDKAYKNVLFMGSIYPSPNFAYPLMLFIRDEETSHD